MRTNIHTKHSQGLLLLDVVDMELEALLVGTVSGVYVTFTNSHDQYRWARMGSIEGTNGYEMNE